MCEPLRGKKQTYNDIKDMCFDDDGEKLIPDYTYRNDKAFDFDDVKSAVEFYKEYLDNPHGIYYERQDLFYEYYLYYWRDCEPDENQEGFGYVFKETVNGFNGHIEFNAWLFKYCFGDVIE